MADDTDKILLQKIRNPQDKDDWLITLYVTADKKLHLHGYLETVDAVSNENLRSKVVTSDKIDDGAVTSDKIYDGAVVNSKIDDGAVTSSKIDSNAVTNSKIYPGAVTGSKITSNSISESHINSGQISPRHFSNNICTKTSLSTKDGITNYKISFRFSDKNWE